MQTANIIVHQAATDTYRLPQRIERKFYIVPRNIGLAETLLRHVCRPDDAYPAEQINSLYFDTADLDQHERSLSGEFRKDKIRIRWYGNGDLPETAPVFVELKSRQGFSSTKQRLRLEVPATRLSPQHLGEGIIAGTELIGILAGFGYFTYKPLRPIIRISYWRHRFTEMLTGAHVALDGHIRSTMLAPGYGSRERELELPGAVIEVKGTGLELPPALRRLKILDIDWSRFSKYSGCIDAHREEPGTVGYLAPSGKII